MSSLTVASAHVFCYLALRRRALPEELLRHSLSEGFISELQAHGMGGFCVGASDVSKLVRAIASNDRVKKSVFMAPGSMIATVQSCLGYSGPRMDHHRTQAQR